VSPRASKSIPAMPPPMPPFVAVLRPLGGDTGLRGRLQGLDGNGLCACESGCILRLKSNSDEP
jgi:hypothetical protein